MRSDLKILCLVNFSIVLYLVYLSLDLMALLYDAPMTRDAITRSEVDPARTETCPQTIPKTIHQILLWDKEVPEVWQDAQASIKDMHPDYDYIQWDGARAEAFLAEHYEWFVPIYNNYRYPIEKADAIRYFILYHYGGIYIDFDNGTREKLDSLLTMSAFVRKTNPTGISNDIMGCVPKHPFFAKIISSLERFDRNWLVPYITVMYSTGPLFTSVIFEQYLRTLESRTNKVRVLMSGKIANIYKPAAEIFFTVKGSSWHNSDARSIKYMHDHWVVFLVFFTLLGFSLLFLAFYIELKLIQVATYLTRATYKWMFGRSSASPYISEQEEKLLTA